MHLMNVSYDDAREAKSPEGLGSSEVDTQEQQPETQVS